MSTEPPLSEEQLAALEAEMDRIHVDDVVLQTVVSLINLAARRAGLAAASRPSFCKPGATWTRACPSPTPPAAWWRRTSGGRSASARTGA